MDTTDRKKGAALSAKNGRALYESALAVEELGHAGCAASLFVLCAEECAKAITLGFENQWQTEEDIRKLFKNHKYKHSQAVHYSSMIHQLIGLTQDAEEGKPRHGECGVIEYIDEWGLDANITKKLGFYVDFREGKWLSPEDITLSQLQSSRFQAESLLSVAEAFFLYK